MKIMVAGSGCARCAAVESNVRKAVADLGIASEISHCYDIKEFARLGISLTPAVLVDGKVKVAGRVPSADELCILLKGHTNGDGSPHR